MVDPSLPLPIWGGGAWGDKVPGMSWSHLVLRGCKSKVAKARPEKRDHDRNRVAACVWPHKQGRTSVFAEAEARQQNCGICMV